MDVTKLGQELIRDEGMRLKPYICPAGKLTIGVGRNIEDMGVSEDEAWALLANDIRRVSDEMDRNIPWWRTLSDARQRALANMCFNLGWPRLSGFGKMLTALQAGDYDGAAAEALDSRWARQVGDRASRIADMIREG